MAVATSPCRTRLRHERQKPTRIDRGGPSEYQMLHWYNLEEVPSIDESKLSIKQHDNDTGLMTAQS